MKFFRRATGRRFYRRICARTANLWFSPPVSTTMQVISDSGFTAVPRQDPWRVAGEALCPLPVLASIFVHPY